MPFEFSKLVRWARQMAANPGVISRYGIAVAAVLAAMGLRLAFNPVVVYTPYLPFALAVMVAALSGGRGPGLAAVALSAFIVDWFFLRPLHSLAIADSAATWGLGLFVVSVAPIALLVGNLRESLLARARAEEALRRQGQLIDFSHDAVITLDFQRRIIAWNMGAEEMYGWPEKDAVGKVLYELLQTVSHIAITEIDEILRREGRWEGELSQTACGGRRLVVDSRQVLLGGGRELPACILAINRDITERKRTEEALRASQGRFEFVLEAANLGAWDLDLTSQVAWRSPQHDAIFGYPALLPEWTYKTFLDHVLPEDREEVDRKVRQAVASGATLQFECRIRRADGAVRWIWAQGRSHPDQEGRPLRLSGLVSDITARKKMEEDLRQSEAQFRTLAEAIPQLCGIADQEGNFIWYNRRWYEYTGTTFEQTKGWGWQSTLDPEAVPKALERAHHSVATGEPFEMVFPLRGADGVVRPYLTRSMPLRDRDGRVARWFSTATDISEQRKTEDALRKAHSEELARAKELQAIMDAVPVAMFMSRDPECRNIIGNRSAYKLFREPPGSNLSKSAPEGEKPPAARVMRDGREIPPHELPVQKAAATRQAVYDVELELAFEDGSRGNIIGNAVPILDAEGRSRGSVGVFVDITERKRAEERLRQVQKLETVGLLAGGIAHDFNNLLTVIMGNADSLRNKYPSSGELQSIIKASERAAHLTSQLLAYSGKGQFFARTFNLSDLVSRSAQLLPTSIPKRVGLVFNLPEEELLIKADPSQIEQILMNLLINAGEAIPPRTDGRIEIVTGSCEITSEMAGWHAPTFDARPGQYVWLEVIDNGSGMDAATLAQIFDPFFSTKFKGRGLGLAAVQGIVRSCNGFIDVHSSPGAGSTFRVFLPRAAAEKPAAEIPAGAPSGALRRDRRRATILVVDDEEMVRTLAGSMLRHLGYEVLEAKDGRGALEVLACAASLPSLALVDLTMPLMGGDELVPILNRDYPGVRIIVTSGYPEEEARSGFPSGAVAGFLQKPYTLATLTEKVDRTLESGGGPQKAAPAPS